MAEWEAAEVDIPTQAMDPMDSMAARKIPDGQTIARLRDIPKNNDRCLIITIDNAGEIIWNTNTISDTHC